MRALSTVILLAALVSSSCAADGHARKAWGQHYLAPSEASGREVELAALRQRAAPSEFALGAEVQGYAAGVITTLDAVYTLQKHDALTLRVGYNSTDRQDFGRHQEEEGGGPGLGLGYRYYFGPDHDGWLLGARLDVWWLEIDWKDNVGLPTERSGRTDVTVLQPTIEGGYAWRFGRNWKLDLAVSFGAEINVDRSGEDVGEGGIVLGGVTLAYGF